MEVINVYPEYGDEDFYDSDIHKYTFPHEKAYNSEEDRYDDYDEDMYTDSMRFNSLEDYEDFLIWGTDYKDQFF